MEEPVEEEDAGVAIGQDFHVFAIENGIGRASETQIGKFHLHGQFLQTVSEPGGKLPRLHPALILNEVRLLEIIGERGKIKFQIPRFDLIHFKVVAHAFE